VRIIGGMWRGRTIFPPKGTGTRPTTNRVRESMMSILINERGGFEGACVLDALAGSGALGIEALSRGAMHATFCEKERSALMALQRNLDIVGIGRTTVPSAVIKRGDCLSRPPIDTRQPYDLVFLDPPYALSLDIVFSMLSRLVFSESIKDGAIVMYEHSAEDSLLDSLNSGGVSWKTIQQKRYGDTTLDFLRKDMS